jgi:hypothetical protein
MIFEYAVEPEFVAASGNLKDYRFLVGAFGLGRPRMMAEFPALKNWRRQVLQAIREPGGLDASRVTALISMLSDRVVQRPGYLYDGSKPWLVNAEGEDGRCPFHAILARANPRNHSRVLIGDRASDDNPLWKAALGSPVRRNPRDMAIAVREMLAICTEAIFIDPHFGPENPRFRSPLREFVAAIASRNGRTVAPRIEVHTSVKSTRAFFEAECLKNIPQLIPAGWSIKFVRWTDIPQGQNELHNRYILTDVGGVIFGVGLDQGKGNDDINLMDRAQFLAHWDEYLGPQPAFKAELPYTVP